MAVFHCYMIFSSYTEIPPPWKQISSTYSFIFAETCSRYWLTVMKHSRANTAEYAWLHVMMATFILVGAYGPPVFCDVCLLMVYTMLYSDIQHVRWATIFVPPPSSCPNLCLVPCKPYSQSFHIWTVDNTDQL